MRNLKILGVLAGGIGALLCAALLGVWLFVNPNAYKAKIAASVKESTGRELKLAGDIKLSVIPWVALELGPASLGNPPGFSDEPFLSFTHASVRVRLLPLLRQHLQIACARMRQVEAIGRAANPSTPRRNQTWITLTRVPPWRRSPISASKTAA
jgi:AsmA protein